VLSNALKIAAPLRANPAGIGIASATFLMLAILRLPLALVLPAMVATGMLLLGERR
jgi:hypothetical protein